MWQKNNLPEKRKQMKNKFKKSSQDTLTVNQESVIYKGPKYNPTPMTKTVIKIVTGQHKRSKRRDDKIDNNT